MITTALNPLDSSRTYPALRVPGILNQSLGPVRAAAAWRVVRGQHSAAEWASAGAGDARPFGVHAIAGEIGRGMGSQGHGVQGHGVRPRFKLT